MKLSPALLLALIVSSASAATTPSTGFVPTEDFARAPLYSHVQISPDGQSLGFLREFEGKPLLMFYNFQTKKVRGIDPQRLRWTTVTEQQVTSFQWVGDQRAVFTTSYWGEFFAGVTAIDSDLDYVKGLSGLSGMEQQTAQPLFALTTIHYFGNDGRKTLMLDLHEGRGGKEMLFPDVVEVDTFDGGHRTVVKNPGNVTEWGVDFDGAVRCGVTRDGDDFGLIYRSSASDPWRVVPKTPGHSEAIRPVGFDSEQFGLFVAALSPQRRWAIYRFDPATGALGKLVAADPDYDIDPVAYVPTPFSRVLFSREGRSLLGVFYVTDGPRFQWFDSKFAEYQDLLDSHYQKKLNVIVGASHHEEKLLVYSFSDQDPGNYYVLETDKRTLGRVAATMPWIKPEQMAHMYPIKYPARDGQTIHGYLTIPNGQSPKNLPLVVLPHGGPWARDVWGFDPMVQMLANRGYAVLQMNYRGSPGYGAQFSTIAKHEIGRGIQDDIEDGTRWAVSHGLADPHRVAIVGASYGGYSALFALGKSPGLYRCGISIAGVSDWPSLIDEKKSGVFTFAHSHWVEQVGDPKNDADFLRVISPINFADKITAPLLIVQGNDDQIVPPKQAHDMIDALEKAGHPPESLFIAHEGHGFVGEKNRLVLFHRVEDFLAANMK